MHEPALTPSVQTFALESEFQPAATTLRVKEPDISPETRRVLYILPVEEGLGLTWGDGLRTAMALNVHNRFGVTLVAPSFVQLPWYGDRADDPTVRQESHLLRAVMPFVKSRWPCPPERRALLGFSKSGWGAYSLLLRHPDTFAAAAAWDAPLLAERPDSWGMDKVFADADNFAPYRIAALLREAGSAFTQRKRFGLFGYDGFREYICRTHALMDELGIPHDFADGPQRTHHWDGGWVEESVVALAGMLSL